MIILKRNWFEIQFLYKEDLSINETTSYSNWPKDTMTTTNENMYFSSNSFMHVPRVSFCSIFKRRLMCKWCNNGCNKKCPIFPGITKPGQFIIFILELLLFLWSTTYHIKIIWRTKIPKKSLFVALKALWSSRIIVLRIEMHNHYIVKDNVLSSSGWWNMFQSVELTFSWSILTHTNGRYYLF